MHIIVWEIIKYYYDMNISYNWLKEYVDFDLTPDEVAAALTSIGLETGGVEEVQTIKGGLEGLVVGEVLTCEPHPNSDHMHITTVNLGQGEPVQIVCGAANVAAGQKVIVATLGTKLYDGDECFTIKKSKLRGVESNGMICAEDEIGVGTSHEGIIVLPADVVPGTLAKDYYNVKSEYVLEVDITPNRADACSHYGVARDLYAWLIQNGHKATLKRPSVDAFQVDNHDMNIDIVVDATKDLLLNVLKFHPFLIKPNNHELGEMFGVVLKSDDEIVEYAKKLQVMGARNVLISMAGDGAILITETGEVHKIGVPKGTVVNSVGAGDSMVAGFTASYLKDHDYMEALKRGTATGSATAFSEGLATADKVEELYKQL